MLQDVVFYETTSALHLDCCIETITLSVAFRIFRAIGYLLGWASLVDFFSVSDEGSPYVSPAFGAVFGKLNVSILNEAPVKAIKFRIFNASLRIRIQTTQQ